MDFEFLTTERLRLRRITPEVYDHVFASYPNDAVKAFFGFRTESRLQQERERHQKGMATFNKSLTYFQLLDKTTDDLLGWCGFHTWYLEHDRAEIGYGLD